MKSKSRLSSLRKVILAAGSFCALSWAPGTLRAQTPPKGWYSNSCTNPGLTTIDGVPALVATCTNYYQQQQSAVLMAPDSCPTVDVPGQGKLAQIYNINGNLRCVFKPAKNDPTGNGNWDLIGKTTWTDDKGEIQKTFWTIDQPTINAIWTQYLDIKYQPGDRLIVLAGGCEQTGGSGNTWKRYVNPNGDNSGPPNGEYFGLARLPATDAPQFDPPNPPPAIAYLLNHTWIAYRNPLDPPDQTQFVTLGFVDDGFSSGNTSSGYPDNGYYSHDEGDNGQCTANIPGSYNDGPAWVSIEVDHTLKPTAAPWSEGSRPFDVVFNQIDANNLPQNPEWYAQLHPPDNTKDPTQYAPDFNAICGPAFSTPALYSAGNVATDLTAAGTGAALGAAAGSALGPVGAAVGGVLGAIGGFLFGSDTLASTATTMDTGKLNQICTSQPVAMDQFNPTSSWGSAILAASPAPHQICGANPIRGHLNYEPVTYTGSLRFSDWSGVWPQDNDLNISLVAGTSESAGKNDSSLVQGMTAGSVSQAADDSSEIYPDGGFLIEFDASETVSPYFQNRPEGSFWRKFGDAVLTAGPSGFSSAVGSPPPSKYASGVESVNDLLELASAASPPTFYLNASVTGLMGVDAVHSGGMAELHPVFSLAAHLLKDDVNDSTGKSETWAFFIRNQGDEGNCADQIHTWAPEEYGSRDYYISIPWPSDKGKPDYKDVSGTITSTAWVGGSVSDKQVLATPGYGTFLHFQSPPYTPPADVPFFGYDGEVTLKYTFADSAQPKDQKQESPKLISDTSSSEPRSTVSGRDEAPGKDANDTKADGESYDAEDFPWQKIIASIDDPAIKEHLTKYFLKGHPAPKPGPPLAEVKQDLTVKYIPQKAMPREARLPHRTHERLNIDQARDHDETARQAGYARRPFQAVDRDHVFYLDTDLTLRFKEGPFASSGDQQSANSAKMVDQDVLNFSAVSSQTVLVLGQNGLLYSESAPFSVNTSGICKEGYVWRAAFTGDKVCVTPAIRDEAAADNQAASSRVELLSFLEPGTCKPGYVWRQANESDHVCVPPDVRSQAAEDNKLAASRVASGTERQFLAWPVTRMQPISAETFMALGANGKLYSLTLPYTSHKPVLIGEHVRSFEALDDTHALALTSDDKLQTLPAAAPAQTTHAEVAMAAPAAQTYSAIWDFHRAADGSLFAIDADDTLWNEQTQSKVDTDVRKVQQIDVNTVFVLKNDKTLSLRSASAADAAAQNIAIASNIRDFQALDGQTVFALEPDGKLWLISLNAAGGTPSKALVADDVR